MNLTVVIPTHNPHPERLARTLAGLRAQTLPTREWELLLVDNASTECSTFATIDCSWHPQARIIREPQLGLTPARLRGFKESAGQLIVLVDDDNVLAPDYLAQARAAFVSEPEIGAAGGRSLPEFDTTPPLWVREFDGLLALRDPGDSAKQAAWHEGVARSYPRCAPIGAGLILRRSMASAYVAAIEGSPFRRALDRTGSQLVSGGDNDLVMTILEAGKAVAYLPALRLTHLIPAGRTTPQYLGRLNRAIARSWIRVLACHNLYPWKAISPATVPLRQARAWLRHRAWRGPASWVRWQGACGHFEGLANIGL